jgi:hypothetical protein
VPSHVLHGRLTHSDAQLLELTSRSRSTTATMADCGESAWAVIPTSSGRMHGRRPRTDVLPDGCLIGGL